MDAASLPTSPHPHRGRELVVVVGESEYHQQLAEAIRNNMKAPGAEEAEQAPAVVVVEDAAAAEHVGATNAVAMLIVEAGTGMPEPDAIVREIATKPGFCATRFVVVSSVKRVRGVSWLIDTGRLHWVEAADRYQDSSFHSNLAAQLTTYREISTEVPTRSALDVHRFPFSQDHSDSEIMQELLALIDEYLGVQPRIVIPEGVKLIKQGKRSTEVLLVERGTVTMVHRRKSGEPVAIHEGSTSRVIGLLTLASRRKTFFTVTTSSEVIGVHLTAEQLSSVITSQPQASRLISSLFIRSLDQRLRRSEQLQVQHFELAQQLEGERSQLAAALKNLEHTRSELVAQERLASLGSLASGMAHELNNPLAAIEHIAHALVSNLPHLLQSSPDSVWADQAIRTIESSHDAPALSARRERELKRTISELVSDPTLAHRLVVAGVQDPELVRELAGGSLGLEGAESAATIGAQLRDLSSTAERISELVSSLRSYARPDGDPVKDVDVHRGIEDTLRLVSYLLHGITIERDYGELPVISCHPSQLAQVWTNIVANAADAMTEAARTSATSDPVHIGTITVRTSVPTEGWITVAISDNGPGIPPAILPHVFEPRFTTKSGQVRFGLGIGLPLCRSIVAAHHGTMRIETGSTGTTVTVDLPINGLPEPAPPRDTLTSQPTPTLPETTSHNPADPQEFL